MTGKIEKLTDEFEDYMKGRRKGFTTTRENVHNFLKRKGIEDIGLESAIRDKFMKRTTTKKESGGR